MCGIKSIRIDLKKSQKAKKEIINSDIYEYEKLLCKSLSKKTGLELFFGDDSFLEYKKNETGEIISSKKSSKSARQDLMEAINAKDFIYNIFLKNNDEEIHGANSSHRNKEDFAGGMHIDIADIENINTKNSSYDIGMIFLHELNHGYFGLSDPTGAPEIKKTLWRTKFGGEDMHGLYSITKRGKIGKTVARVNVYREELGLPIRISYNSVMDMNGKNRRVPFERRSGKVIWLECFPE